MHIHVFSCRVFARALVPRLAKRQHGRYHIAAARAARTHVEKRVFRLHAEEQQIAERHDGGLIERGQLRRRGGVPAIPELRVRGRARRHRHAPAAAREHPHRRALRPDCQEHRRPKRLSGRRHEGTRPTRACEGMWAAIMLLLCAAKVLQWAENLKCCFREIGSDIFGKSEAFHSGNRKRILVRKVGHHKEASGNAGKSESSWLYAQAG